jgi:acyl-[acyl carrier protein]--UDP-N-acetylglucosamine O-acyltransferase
MILTKESSFRNCSCKWASVMKKRIRERVTRGKGTGLPRMMTQVGNHNVTGGIGAHIYPGIKESGLSLRV